MSKMIRVVQFGLGPIGIECARSVLEKETTDRIKLVGAVDIDPEKVETDLADLLDANEPTGIIVGSNAEQILNETEPDAVIHTTTSFLDEIQPQLELCARSGVHVVSSSEELAYPYEQHPRLSRKLDDVAAANGVVIHGTGVNPGYAMDTLALTATGVCTEVERISVTRVVDAGLRRRPLQEKIGAGLTKEAFEAQKEKDALGHVGLRESLHLVAAGLEWSLDEARESLEPVIAREKTVTPLGEVAAGNVAGIRHRISGFRSGKEILTLNLRIFLGAPEEYDAVHVAGDPPIDLTVREGIFGDSATVGALINALPRVIRAEPGVRTTADLPLPRAYATFNTIPADQQQGLIPENLRTA